MQSCTALTVQSLLKATYNRVGSFAAWVSRARDATQLRQPTQSRPEIFKMQRSLAFSIIGRLGFVYGTARGTAVSSSSCRLTDQYGMFSSEAGELPQPLQGAAKTSNSDQKPIAVSLTWSSPVEKNKVSRSRSPAAAVKAITLGVPPSLIKRRAEAALRMKERAGLKAARDKAALAARSLVAKAKARQTILARKDAAGAKQKALALSAAAKAKAVVKLKTLQAAKDRTKLKVIAHKEKSREEAKVQVAKAKVQQAKAEEDQRKKLHVKRVATAYILFMTDHLKTVSHVAPAQRFKRMSILYKELTSEQKQAYVDAALKLKTESASSRAAIKAGKVQQYVPRTAYMLFCREKFPEVKAANTSAKLSEVMRLIGEQWRVLSENDKQLLKARMSVETKNVTIPVTATL